MVDDGLLVRPVEDRDGPALVTLVGAAYAEYPGCVLDLPDLDADLPAPGTTAARRGGRWWVVEDGGSIVATVGTGALGAHGRVELKRLYVAASHRRRGLAGRLVRRVEAHAAGVGAGHVVLWSDTRFGDAHRLYAAHGYADTGARRDLHDPSHTTEIGFAKPLPPAAPRRSWTWSGPFGVEQARWFHLPDGVVLAGAVPDAPSGRLTYVVEVDAQWRTRCARVDDEDATRVLTSDGAGTWWRDGAAAPELAGCLDVDLQVTPVTNTLPIRRAGAGPVTAAWVRVPGPAVEPLHHAYEDDGGGRWTYRSDGGFVSALTVDHDQVVVTYGQQHPDGSTTSIWTRLTAGVRHDDTAERDR